MNLHGLVAGAVSRVNPTVTASFAASIGNVVGADFVAVPAYSAAVDMQVQRQALTFKDLQMLDGVNLGGEAVALYCTGEVVGVRRPDGKGGDLFTMPDGSKYLVVHVLENWFATAGWTKVAAVRQLT